MKKIFFIGMNRCATKSFHFLFKGSGYRSFHYSCSGNHKSIILAEQMLHNINNFYPILRGIDESNVYSDMFWHREDMWIDGVKFYEELYNDYPDAYFILQTRDMKDWLVSKNNHKKGDYIKRCGKYWHKRDEEMLKWFEQDRNEHHEEVLSFFKNKNRFLQYNIDSDEITKLIEFVKPDFFLEEKHWGHHGQTV